MTLYKPAIGNRIEDDINGMADNFDALDFKGALLQKTADQAITTSTLTKATWDSAVYDEGGFWNVAAPTRLTIPAGASRVRLTFSADFDATTNRTRVSFYKNGSDAFVGNARTDVTAGARNLQVVTPVLSVVQGDYFEAQVFHTHGSNRGLRGVTTTNFSIEVVES